MPLAQNPKINCDIIKITLVFLNPKAILYCHVSFHHLQQWVLRLFCDSTFNLLWLVSVNGKDAESTKKSTLIDHWPLALYFLPPIYAPSSWQATGCDSHLKSLPAAMIPHTAWWLLRDSWLWHQLWFGCWTDREVCWHLSPAYANVSDTFGASFRLVNLPFK